MQMPQDPAVQVFANLTQELTNVSQALMAQGISNIVLRLDGNPKRGARWLSGKVSDSGARGRGFETYLRHVVSLSKTLYSPKVLVNYPGSGGSVPT